MPQGQGRQGLNPPWAAERTVSPELARNLIASRFPELAPVRVESPSEGWDNIAYRVNGTWIFRFPRRTIVVDLIRTEAAVLPVIAARLPLPVPLPVFVGEPRGAFPLAVRLEEGPFPRPLLGRDDPGLRR